MEIDPRGPRTARPDHRQRNPSRPLTPSQAAASDGRDRRAEPGEIAGPFGLKGVMIPNGPGATPTSHRALVRGQDADGYEITKSTRNPASAF